MGNSQTLNNQLNSLSHLEKLKWKLAISMSASITQHLRLIQDPKYSQLLNILNKIPDCLFVKFAQRINLAIFYRDPYFNFDHHKNFINWPVTFNSTYQEILYPSDVPAKSGQQVAVIQQFVKKGVREGKRIRCSGMRHSWGSTFSDSQQLLISFYPYQIAKGMSQQLDNYSIAMTKEEETLAKENIEHLCMIRKVGEAEVTEFGKTVVKHLVKIGAGVSNDQLRRWCIKNGFQFKSNAIMVEINFCGALGTCSHGAGLETQTLADYVYEIEFIDHNGDRQVISKKTTPHLIHSAASAMGLLGPVVFVTLQMDQLEIVKTLPRTNYKDIVIPWPKNYSKEKQEARRNRKEWKAWTEIQGGKPQQGWQYNFQKFKQAIHQTYCEWFYFPMEQLHIFENVWSTVSKKTPENIAKIKKDNPQGLFIEDYPPPAIRYFSEFVYFTASQLMNHELTSCMVNVLLRAPFAFFPFENMYLNYPDAIHFQRGIQNAKVRSFQCDINIPAIRANGEPELDYDLIQQIWWAALEIAEETRNIMNLALEMRILKGSDATLAPQKGFDFVCSIEILRTQTLNERIQKQWRAVVMRTFNAWRNMTDSQGIKLTIRPHWAKEWSMYPDIKQCMLKDEELKNNLRQFLKDYQEIIQLKGSNKKTNLFTFSNQIYRELMNNVIEEQKDKIE